MGWETTLYTYISFNRETYDSLEKVNQDIDDLETEVKSLKEQLNGLVLITEPKKYCDDEDDPMYWMQRKCRDIIELIEEYNSKLTLLYILKNRWNECHDMKGSPKLPPKDIGSYIDGDYIS
jgi:hypothetical protein